MQPHHVQPQAPLCQAALSTDRAAQISFAGTRPQRRTPWLLRHLQTEKDPLSPICELVNYPFLILFRDFSHQDPVTLGVLLPHLPPCLFEFFFQPFDPCSIYHHRLSSSPLRFPNAASISLYS